MPKKPGHDYLTDRWDSSAEMSDDEREFVLAMERFRRESGHKFPTCCEVLKVLKSLGYRKTTTNRGDGP